MARDYYDVLGVPRSAGNEEIQQSFRKLARRYHPDVNKDPSAEDRFKEINEAYSVLSDPDQRRRYDRYGENFRQVPEGWEEAARSARAGAGAGRSRGGGGGGRRVYRSTGGSGDYAEVDLDDLGGGGFGGIDFDDLFGGLFGGRGRGGPIPGADQEAEIQISVEDTYRDSRRQIVLSGPDGQRTIDVTIPAGVTDGQRVRVPGEGGRGGGGGGSGDLYLIARITPHPQYRVVGRDVYVDLRLAPWEAALGTTVPIDTPQGEAELRVPPGSSTGRRLRLRGEGLPNPSGTPGNLHAEVKIMVPKKPTERERELFSQLARESNFNPRRR